MQLGTSRSVPTEPNHGRAWYALYTRHQHEKAVNQVLSGKGFETFLPLYTVSRQWKDRVKQLSLPLFPCYVFLRGGLERRLDILTTPGVHKVVESAGRPAVIPDLEIDAVRQVVKKSMKAEPHPFLKCGDWVRIKSGPLTGIEGMLVRKKNSFRLILSVELLEKSLAVELDACIVERISRPIRNATARGVSANVPNVVRTPRLPVAGTQSSCRS